MRTGLKSGGELSDVSSLTEREIQVIRLVAEGCSHEIIAKKLAIMPRTVGKHCLGISNKLNVTGVAGITRWAVGHGLVEAIRTENSLR